MVYSLPTHYFFKIWFKCYLNKMPIYIKLNILNKCPSLPSLKFGNVLELKFAQYFILTVFPCSKIYIYYISYRKIKNKKILPI